MVSEERKIILKNALINSFVDDYSAYKSTIKFINNDLKTSNINFEYSYDEFCTDFLNETLSNIEDIDIFNEISYNNFYINYWQFNLFNLQCMLHKKLLTLGYKYEDFYKNSNIKEKVKKKYLK